MLNSELEVEMLKKLTVIGSLGFCIGANNTSDISLIFDGLSQKQCEKLDLNELLHAHGKGYFDGVDVSTIIHFLQCLKKALNDRDKFYTFLKNGKIDDSVVLDTSFIDKVVSVFPEILTGLDISSADDLELLGDIEKVGGASVCSHDPILKDVTGFFSPITVNKVFSEPLVVIRDFSGMP